LLRARMGWRYSCAWRRLRPRHRPGFSRVMRTARALRRAAAVLGAVPGRGPALPGRNNGVKDFDVWSFHAGPGDRPFPYRWRGRPISAPPGSAVIRVTRRLCRPARRPARAVAARAARRRPGSRPARLPVGSPHRIGKGTGGQGDHPDRPGRRRRRMHLALADTPAERGGKAAQRVPGDDSEKGPRWMGSENRRCARLRAP
jgi:hypothetical protein